MSMIDLTNDQLQAKTQACLLEIERRLMLINDDGSLNLVRRAHGILKSAEERLHIQGQVSALSIGGDKGD